MTDIQLLDILLLADKGQMELNRTIYGHLVSFPNRYNYIRNSACSPTKRPLATNSSNRPLCLFLPMCRGGSIEGQCIIPLLKVLVMRVEY